MVFTKLIRFLLFPLKLLKWALSWIGCSIIMALIISTPVEGLSEAQRGAISQNCSTIRQSLEQLQKVDSKIRISLGTTYETIATKFITPLNLRLVRNNLPTLSTIQSDFTLGQAAFRSSYTDYMRAMEELMAIDCRTEPDHFYDTLVKVRKQREALRESVDHMSALTKAQSKAVKELMEDL